MSSMLDRLRESAMEEDEELFGPEVGSDLAVRDEDIQEHRILGMTAVERMLLSVLLFIATSVLGTLLLIALERIDIGL
jgi:hypothetical protein